MKIQMYKCITAGVIIPVKWESGNGYQEMAHTGSVETEVNTRFLVIDNVIYISVVNRFTPDKRSETSVPKDHNFLPATINKELLDRNPQLFRKIYLTASDE